MYKSIRGFRSLLDYVSQTYIQHPVYLTKLNLRRNLTIHVSDAHRVGALGGMLHKLNLFETLDPLDHETDTK